MWCSTARWRFVTANRWVDFELLAERVHRPRHAVDGHQVSFFVFDVLQLDGREQCNKPWRGSPGAPRRFLSRRDARRPRRRFGVWQLWALVMVIGLVGI
jgi:hypothetical protein